VLWGAISRAPWSVCAKTGQRLTSILVPPLMGGIADRWGISQSFFILGAFMLLLCVPVALVIRRIGRLPPADEPRAG
jgi:Na+/melibiose symporter-like transporter